MGRTLAGNTAKPKTIKLTQLLGGTSLNTVDSVTKSSSTYGGVAFQTQTVAAIKKNTALEQQQGTNTPFLLQDEVAAYSLVYTYSSGNNWRNWIFDDDLNVVDVLPQVHASFGYSVQAVRLYNGKIYWIGANGTSIRVGEYDIASRTYANYDVAHGLGSQPSIAVFNWPVNGKFHILYWSPGNSPYKVGVLTFDLASKGFAAPFPQWTGSSASYLNSFYAFHVKDDGSAVSAAGYNGAQALYGVWTFVAGSASYNGYSSSGQASWSRGGNATWVNPATLYVTKDCIIDSNPLTTTNGSTYYTWVTHLRGGDASVQGQEFAGPTPYQYPVQSMSLNPSRHNMQLATATINGQSGMYNAVRTGSTLSFTYVRPDVANMVPCQLAGSFVGVSYSGGDTSAYLSAISMRTEAGRTGSWSWSANYGNSINGLTYYPGDIKDMTFVTRKGKLFGCAYRYSSTGASYAVTTQIPYLCPAQSVNYSVSVVGGGGSSVTSSTVHGTSSSFAGIAAAPGQIRTGGRYGSQVITSGPSRGTGGTGYFDELFGQGEDSTGSGQYGGGSGYLATGTVSIAAGEVVPYVAGLPPQYGGQGAIVLAEI